jgi:hypothetical protein
VAAEPKHAWEKSAGRATRVAKQAGAAVGLCSALAGLVFLFFPGLKPARHVPPAAQSASITGVVVNPRTTRGQFLDYSDQSKLGFTGRQLGVAGASAFARLQIVGYRGRTLILERQVVDAGTGEVVDVARDFGITPSADRFAHRWWDWTPLRRGRGRYVMVIKLFDERSRTAIACGQTAPFGGLGGGTHTAAPRLCEGS